jgi:hypothetical protein
MAYEFSNYSVKATLVAGADLSAKQYTFVKLNSSGQAVAVAAATDLPIGILQNAPLSGQEAEILISGGSKLVLGGTVAAAGVIGTSATGTGVAIAHGTDTTKFALGQALTGGATGEVVTVAVSCSNAGHAA